MPDALQHDLARKQLAQAVSLAQRDAPDLAPVKTYGWILQHVLPANDIATTSPFGTIYVNPDAVAAYGKDPQGIADVLIHEQTHARQARQRGWAQTLLANLLESEPYARRPDEMEALQAETARRTARGLPTRQPSFLAPGEFRTLGRDIEVK